ncbi:MAG: hypothetical protein RL367_1662 [Pseudomonadota bacterium]
MALYQGPVPGRKCQGEGKGSAARISEIGQDGGRLP